MVLSTTVSEDSTVGTTQKEQAIYRWAFWLLLLIFEVFLFTLPVMPSGDGPLHIYMSSIMWKLATHSSPLYSHFYAIRHLVQPYSFHYYLLISLEHWFTPDRAEEIFVGLIWATLAIGFRQLARTLGTGAGSVSLWVFPLLFSWPLGGGFFNYTFATGLLLFALAFYTRLTADLRPARSLAWFAVMLILLVLAHPLPLLLLIVLIGIDAALQMLGQWRTQRSLRLPLWSLIALGLSCLAFVFPILIADKAQVADSIENGLGFHFYYLRYLLDGRRLSYFVGYNVFGWLYDLSIVAIAPVCTLLFLRSGILSRLRSSSLNPADRLLLGSLIYLFATMFFPPNMNGSALFAVRMFFMIWLVAAPCAAWVVQSRTANRVVAVTALAASLLSLVFAFLYLRPAARMQWQIEHAPVPSNARGIFLQKGEGSEDRTAHMTYSLFFWEAGRTFAAHNDVLLNTPWLQLTIVPVAGRAHSGLLDNFAPNSASENPGKLAQYLEDNPKVKAQVLAESDFLLLADPGSPVPQPLQLAGAVLGSDAAAWRCKQQNFYAVCTKK